MGELFLWGLVGIRLAFPFSIESIFSLIPSAKPIPSDIEYAAIPQIDAGIKSVNTVINPVLANRQAAIHGEVRLMRRKVGRSV